MFGLIIDCGMIILLFVISTVQRNTKYNSSQSFILLFYVVLTIKNATRLSHTLMYNTEVSEAAIYVLN